MIYSLAGKLTLKKPDFAVIEASGIGFKVFICSRTFKQLPKINSRLKLFTHLNISQNGAEFYGFLSEKELGFFELLNTVSGIGPKVGLKIIEVMKIESLVAAVSQGRIDLLTKTAGIGNKKAGRIILELSGKIKDSQSEKEIPEMESNLGLEQVLKSLGYKQKEIREAVSHLPPKLKTIEQKLKASLKLLA